MHKIYGNRSNYSGSTVFSDFIDYAGTYQLGIRHEPIGICQLVRALKEQYRANHSSVTAAQIANLRKRLYLTRAMQVTGTGSLLLCVVSMFFIYIQLYLVSIYIFGLAMVLLIISLAISVYEIYISVKALEIHLDDMDE